MTDADLPKPDLELSSDELGDVGEAAFRLLCARAPLIANPSGRDRAGWDFIVQDRAENPVDTSLDRRAVLWTNYVQVKAIWKRRDPRVRLTLSAAEKLAKQTDPAFIAAFVYDRENLDLFDLYMVEMTGDRLAFVLKALRQHERSGRRAVNERHTYIPLKRAERLPEPTGPAIRERLAGAHRAAAPQTYAELKAQELRTIGYGERPVRGTLTLLDIDRSSLFDVFLGKTAWPAHLSGMVETRFGIELPLKGAPEGTGTIRFSPIPQARCELVAKARGRGRPHHFVGDHHHIALPGPNGLISRSRFVFPGFTVESGQGPVQLDLALTDETRLTLSGWRRLWRLMHDLTASETAFTLRSSRFSAPFKWELPARPDLADGVKSPLWVTEAAYDLAEDLNLNAGSVSWNELARSSRTLMMARHFGAAGSPRMRISLTSVHAGDEGYDRSPQEGVYVDYVDLGGHRIGFVTRLRLSCAKSGDDSVWESTREKRVEMRTIGSTEEAFAEFTREAKALEGLSTLFLGEDDDGFLERALGEVGEF